MSEGSAAGRRRARIWATILVLAAVTLVALAVRAYVPIYSAGRIAQASADGAALAGAMRLAHALQKPAVGEDQIVADMVKFATLNGLGDNDSVVGYYLDAECNRLGLVGSGIPQEPRGIEAVVTTRVPILLTRGFGLGSWSAVRQASGCFEVEDANGQGVPKIHFNFDG